MFDIMLQSKSSANEKKTEVVSIGYECYVKRKVCL